MSRVELREADLDSPLRARSLFTVAAAICLARLVERPCFFSLALLCSYCRSRFALHACRGIEKRLSKERRSGFSPSASRCNALLERRDLHVRRCRVPVEHVDERV